MKVKTWIRVNPENEDDRRNALAVAPDEERTHVSEAFTMASAMGHGTCYLVLFDNEEVEVYSETFFNKNIRPTLPVEEDDGGSVEESARESVAVFEFTGDWMALGFWSSTVDPDATPYDFENLKHGDLVMYRGGKFDIYVPKGRPVAAPASVDHTALKIQALAMALDAPARVGGGDSKPYVEVAQEFYEWLSGS